jgi:hypothetical protein
MELQFHPDLARKLSFQNKFEKFVNLVGFVIRKFEEICLLKANLGKHALPDLNSELIHLTV